jgi:4-amino-4-deoxy-L-arabinose transferase-like glycosyltransferase
LGVLVFIVLVNAGGMPLLADPDSQWHVAIGKWIVTNGAVPTVDSHSHTFLGKPWIAKEWLSQVAFAAAFGVGGWAGVVVLAAAAIAAAFALLLRLLLRDLAPLPALVLALAAAAMWAPQFLARPHVLALPFTLLWVAGLVQAVEHRRAPQPVLLLAMLMWANLHGGFTLGLLLRSLCTRGRARRRRRCGTQDPVRRLVEIHRCRGRGGLPDALRAGVDARYLPHLQSRQRAVGDPGMELARFP